MRRVPNLLTTLVITATCTASLDARQTDTPSPGEAGYVATLLDPEATRAQRESAAYWILKERYSTPSTIDALIRVAADPTLDITSREVVGHALGEVAELDPALTRRIVSLSTDADRNRRWTVAVSLRHVAAGDDEAFAALLARVDDDDRTVRARAVTSIGMVRRPFPADWPGAKELVLSWWRHDDPFVRRFGWSHLGQVLDEGEWLDLVAHQYLRGELEWTDAVGAARGSASRETRV